MHFADHRPNPARDLLMRFGLSLEMRVARNAEVLRLLSSRFAGRKTALKDDSRCRGQFLVMTRADSSPAEAGSE